MAYSREVPVGVLLGLDAVTLSLVMDFLPPARLFDAVLAPAFLYNWTVDILTVSNDIHAFVRGPVTPTWSEEWRQHALNLVNCIAQIGIGSPDALLQVQRLTRQGPWNRGARPLHIRDIEHWVRILLTDHIHFERRELKNGMVADLALMWTAWPPM
jgi:hypothetical protein